MKKKLIIIGGGLAGLSAGIYGSLNGFECEIYEKNPVAGGQCMGWNRKGHHIDNCIHWLTGTREGSGLRKLWDTIGALDKETRFASVTQFYTSELEGRQATLWKDLDRTEQELIELSREDEPEIRRLIHNVRLAGCCEIPVLKPMDMMNPVDYMKLGLAMADMGKVMKEYGKINVEELAERFKHPLLKQLIKDYMPSDYQASAFLVSYATVASGNGDIPEGGSLDMARRITGRYRSLGGKLMPGRTVCGIKTEGGKAEGVILEDGTLIRGDYVICAVDAYEAFYRIMGRNYMNHNWKKTFEDREAYPVFSGFHIAFSADADRCPAEDTVFWDSGEYTICNKVYDRMSLKSYSYEPGFAPEGKVVLQVNLMQKEDDFTYWKSLNKQEYALKKQEYATVLLKKVEERYPGLEGHTELLDVWTPLTYERYCNSFHGAYMGFIMKNQVKSFYDSGVIKGLKNVFLSGQWTQAPGGLPVAAASGKFTIQRIARKEKVKFRDE